MVAQYHLSLISQVPLQLLSIFATHTSCIPEVTAAVLVQGHLDLHHCPASPFTTDNLAPLPTCSQALQVTQVMVAQLCLALLLSYGLHTTQTTPFAT